VIVEGKGPPGDGGGWRCAAMMMTVILDVNGLMMVVIYRGKVRFTKAEL